MAIAQSLRRRAELRRTMLFAGLVWVVVAGLHLSGWLGPLELRLLDWRFRIRGERVAPPGIALVGVDDATIRGFGAWPLPRDLYALLVAALEESGARAVGVDLQLPDDPHQDPRSNQLLAQVSEAGGNVVHSVWFQSSGTASGRERAEVAAALARRGVPAGDVPVARAEAVALPYDELLAGRVPFGHISVAVDADGTIRRLPLLVRYEDRIFPALSLRLAGLLRDEREIESVTPTRGGVLTRWRRGATLFIPTDPEGATALDFAGDRTAFPSRHSMLEVLQWYRNGDSERLHDAFSGRVVLVGLTAHEEVSEDVGPTPFSATAPLMLVHANALENLIRGRFLTRVPDVLYLVALAIGALALGFLFTRLSVPGAVILAGGSMLAFAVLDLLLLARWSLDLPPLAGLLLPALVYAAAEGNRHLSLQRHAERREAEIREGLTVQQRFLPDALVGKTLSHYTLDEKLGSGGMGEVYRARDARDGRTVAVKVLLGGGLADEMQRRRFRREARAHSRFRHPGAAAFHEFDSQDGIDFIVMEFVPGTSLATRLESGPLPECEAIRIARDVCEVLVEAHALGIVHRDIKPANVILDPRGVTKLLDFGVARLSAPESGTTMNLTLTESGAIVGTPAYVAPEMILGRPAVPGTDLYGVGLLLFEMTTGRRPFPDDHPHELMHLILNQPPPSPRVLNARLTPEIEAIILRTLEKDPGARFRDAVELLSALRSVA